MLNDHIEGKEALESGISGLLGKSVGGVTDVKPRREPVAVVVNAVQYLLTCQNVLRDTV
ncbi:MAG TPA: hypothetical protein VI322_05630 [Candidatus Saccharimonadia bacterium]